MAQGSGTPGVGAGRQRGFFRPRHGSSFDLAGRVFRNRPAPSKLERPPHRFAGATRLVIGEGDSARAGSIGDPAAGWTPIEISWQTDI